MEIRKIERAYPAGMSSIQIVEIFQSCGERFSEPTLRKYVQVGLLPKSRRVGVKGRHRGSSGLYPVGSVRQINDIKRALERGATLEEIRLSPVGLRGEVQVLRRTSEQVLRRFAEAVADCPQPGQRARLSKVLEARKRSLAAATRDLEAFALRLGQWHGRG